MNTEQERIDFESWITSPPYEKPINLLSEGICFPVQYRAYEVQLAWEAYQAGRAALLAERDALREALEVMVEMVEMNGFGPPPQKAPDYNPGPLEVSVVGMPEFDALLDHIYEEGTGSEGVVHLANKLVRAAIQSHINYARNAQPVAYKWGGVLIRAEETHPIHRKEGQPLYATPIAAIDHARRVEGDGE